VTEADALLYLPHRDIDRIQLALDIPALSPGWRGSFRELVTAADTDTSATPGSHSEPGWTGFRPLRVTRLVTEGGTVTSVYLGAEDGRGTTRSVARALPDAGASTVNSACWV
jgi:hypothetical protein